MNLAHARNAPSAPFERPLNLVCPLVDSHEGHTFEAYGGLHAMVAEDSLWTIFGDAGAGLAGCAAQIFDACDDDQTVRRLAYEDYAIDFHLRHDSIVAAITAAATQTRAISSACAASKTNTAGGFGPAAFSPRLATYISSNGGTEISGVSRIYDVSGHGGDCDNCVGGEDKEGCEVHGS